MSLDLTTARDRIRLGVGDTDDTDVLMPGGLTTYDSLITLSSGDEVAAWRSAAASLAADFATQPVRISASGKSLDYSARVAQWNRIADGKARYISVDAGGSLRGLWVGGASPPMFRRDSLGTVPELETLPTTDDTGATL